MAANFAATLSAIERMKREGVLADYAIGGAMALVFWTEPIPTFDLDVFVRLPGPSTRIVSLDSLYRWADTNRTAKRLQRVAVLQEEATIDPERLQSVLQRYNLKLPS